MIRTNIYPLVSIALCLSACSGRERQISVADLRGRVVLAQSAGSKSVYFELDSADGNPGSVYSDTHHCPVLRDDVKVILNGAAVSLDNRGGYYAYMPIDELGEIRDGCNVIEGHLDLDALPPLVEIIFSDGTGTISAQSEGLFDQPAIALASGQSQAVKPGDTVRLTFTPATSLIHREQLNPLRLGNWRSIAHPEDPDSPGTVEWQSVPFTQDGGDLLLTMPMVAPGAAQLVLDRPRLDAKVTSCVGAVSCIAYDYWPAYITPGVPFTVVTM